MDDDEHLAVVCHAQGKRALTLDPELTKRLSNFKTLEDFRLAVSSEVHIRPLQLLCVIASLVPRPSRPSVCRLQYYKGEGLVKLSHVV